MITKKTDGNNGDKAIRCTADKEFTRRGGILEEADEVLITFQMFMCFR